MRLSLAAFLVALLIAVVAIGAPIPAKADCAGQAGCNIGDVGMTSGGCGGKGEGCTVAQSCAVQLLKMPTQTPVGIVATSSRLTFAAPAEETLASAFITPETAPPRI